MRIKPFLERVQAHERNWGNKTYKNRPSLATVLDASIVVFWENKDKAIPETMTIHNSLDEIERHFLRLLFTKQGGGNRRIVDVYQNQQRLVVQSVKIVFTEAKDE